jgi:hypothetical protein
VKIKGEDEQRIVRVWSSSSRMEFLVLGFGFVPCDFVMFHGRTEFTKARYDAEYARKCTQMTRGGAKQKSPPLVS